MWQAYFAFEPLTGKRIVELRARRTKVDYAHFLKQVAQHYPNATKTVGSGIIRRHSIKPLKHLQPLSSRFEMYQKGVVVEHGIEAFKTVSFSPIGELSDGPTNGLKHGIEKNECQLAVYSQSGTAEVPPILS